MNKYLVLLRDNYFLFTSSYDDAISVSQTLAHFGKVYIYKLIEVRK